MISEKKLKIIANTLSNSLDWDCGEGEILEDVLLSFLVREVPEISAVSLKALISKYLNMHPIDRLSIDIEDFIINNLDN